MNTINTMQVCAIPNFCVADRIQ